jgi:hypothetical protein
MGQERQNLKNDRDRAERNFCRPFNNLHDGYINRNGMAEN